jgi:hypothetical protein
MKTVVALVALAGLALPAVAQFNSGTLRLSGPFGRQGGGEFTISNFVDSNSGQTLGTFTTFCIERSENVRPPANYNWALNNAAVNGGQDSGSAAGFQAGPDVLSSETKALYEGFRTGQLTTITTAAAYAGTLDEAHALQVAIWYLEDEINGADGARQLTDVSAFANNATVTLLALDYISQASFFANNGLGAKVFALNLTGGPPGGGLNQDMLVMIPLPQGAAMAGVGLALVGIRRRRASL